MSLRARLLLVVAVLAAAGLIAADVVTYAALRSSLHDRVDRSLDASSRVLETALRRRFFNVPDVADQLAALTPGVFIQLRAPGGQVLSSSVLVRRDQMPPAVPRLPATLPNPGDGTAWLTAPAQKGDTSFRVRVEQLPFGGEMVLAAPLTEVQSTLRRLRLIEILVTLAVVAAVVGLGLWLVRVALRPLRRIEETAAAIAAGDLSRRVPDTDPHTEVGRLGAALNVMLAHIERAFEQRAATEERLRRFVADASHELRTPLSSVRAYAELFERGARDRPEDLERVMRGIEAESERMGVLVDDLLLLARLDQGRPLRSEPVDLAGVARDAVDAARAVEPARPLTLDAPADAVVRGDPDRLRQVVDNLLAHVRAHTPPGTPAEVRLDAVDGRAVLEVADAGPGLSDEEAARVFERFYRGDPARSHDGAANGTGLGLSIVAAIVEAHGGRVSAGATPGGGATFRVELLADAPAG